LVLVGQQGWQTQALGERLRAHPESGRRLFWLQGISDEYLEKVYVVSSCLIAASLNEGFGLSLIEAARHGVPIIARDIPVFREVAGDSAFYFQGEAANDLANALGAWLEKYRTCQHPPSSGIPWLTWQQSTEMLKVALVGQHCPRRQLLVDISELVQSDAGTGIQRVTKNVLWEWLKNPPENYRVEPVYATLDDGYKYAKEFTCNFLGLNDEVPGDSPIDYAPGDIFFGLDLCHHTTRVHANYLRHLHEFGLRMLFLVHDLLPIKYPHFWPQQHQVHKVHEEWLDVIPRFDGAVCVSKAVADDLAQWINKNRPGPHRPFSIDYSHNAADIQISISSKVLPDNAEYVLGYLNVSPSFLMVGTLEARKGHLQVLNAFEILWKEGSEVILVIVGKEGWLVDDLVTRLRSHPEVGRHLFWLEGISDEYLDRVYAACTCLIAASYDEGFGLPLIEAAQHKLPIIARDIPVFREVAAEHAYYFEAPTADGFALSIKNWLTLYHQGKHPKSNDMPWLTWNESARRLRDIVLGTATSK
jgi:glycosyltransferase involved in cell wall biosynthesis